ncbi:MAG: hypothetical protein K6D94_10555 [Clostridiales bacterium]|nr:hypothetical protein [Clostridiales bacterium]
MQPSSYRILSGGGIAVLTAAAANIAASLLIRNIAGITASLDSSGALYSRLIQLKSASLSPSWLFPLIFGLVIAAAAMSKKRSAAMKAAAAAVIIICSFSAIVAAVLEMRVNDVPFGSFAAIVLRYIKGGLLDAL